MAVSPALHAAMLADAPRVLSASEVLDFDVQYPPLPRTIAEVSRLMHGEEPDAHALARVVGADPAVASMLLRRVNSVYYALRGRVGDVPRAVTMLGFRETCQVALTTGLTQLREVLATPDQEAVYRELVWRSLGAAYYTHELATATHLAPAPFAFIVGLLSTSGRLALLYNKGRAYPALWGPQEARRVPSVEEERSALGIGHPELAALAARHWNLPQEIGGVLGAVDDLERAEFELRPLVLALLVALDATEGLKGEAAPTQLPGMPPAIEMLAACTETSADQLEAVLAERRERVEQFIASMSA